MPLLDVENLQTYFDTDEGVARAVDGVSFSIEEGESLALVGESACGKSVTAHSLMRLIQPPGRHPGGSIRFAGQDLLRLPEERLRHIRGNDISMIFQEPMTSLNPVFSVANQLAEPLELHQGLSAEAARRRGRDLLAELGIPEPDMVMDSYPHQLSGGMRQRAMIAMAIACRPRLMIADEPTTALDVTVQAQILHLIRRLQQEVGMALLLITHDLGVVNQVADRICVMYAGQMAEVGPRERVLHDPRHPYTVKLLRSIPRGVRRDQRLTVIRGQVSPATEYPEGCRFAPRCDHAAPRCTQAVPPLFGVAGAGTDDRSAGGAACYLEDPHDPLPRQATPAEVTAAAYAEREPGPPLLEVRDLRVHFPVRGGFFRRAVAHVRAVDGVELTIREGTTLGLVGESGCGKTTLGHSVLNLLGEARGEVRFEGRDLLKLPPAEMRRMRRKVQIIFQDPFSSLNPRLTVREILGEGLRIHEPHLDRRALEARVHEALDEVGLSRRAAGAYAHEFSGGQRQRVAVARAIILRPRFIVLDESTSALDVSVQAQVLNLLRDLQARHELTYLFITHDLGVVEYLADEVAVMYLGRIVEQGPTGAVFRNPAHPYTRGLLEAVPSVDERREAPPLLAGDVPSPVAPPPGCHFHPRCPVYQRADDAYLREHCPAAYPAAQPQQTPGHWAKCYAAREGAGLAAYERHFRPATD